MMTIQSLYTIFIHIVTLNNFYTHPSYLVPRTSDLVPRTSDLMYIDTATYLWPRVPGNAYPILSLLSVEVEAEAEGRVAHTEWSFPALI